MTAMQAYLVLVRVGAERVADLLGVRLLVLRSYSQLGAIILEGTVEHTEG